MQKLGTYLWYWAPPLLFMAVIFYLSAQPSVQVSESSTADFLAHKIVHVIEYAILYMLVFRAVYKSDAFKSSFRTQLWISLAISLVYAASDEVHQTYVPTRTGKLRDVFIDLIGISLCFLYTKHYIRFIKKFLF